MIAGVVNADYEAVIRLEVQGPAGQKREVVAIGGRIAIEATNNLPN